VKRSGFKNPGKGFKPRTEPMARGSSQLRTTKPLERGEAQLVRTPMPRASKPMAAVGARAKRTGQGKVAPTAAEADWMARAQAFGCIVCYLHAGHVRTPAAIHHILQGGRRMGHLYTLPLCDPGHHQNSPSPLKISRHPNKARFDAAYGTELELLAQLQQLLGA
jgi:hypothetical protein